MENQAQTLVNNFERTRPSSSKVTVGFKCSPELKLRLNNSAVASNLSLSEYCEMIVSTSDTWRENEASIKEVIDKVEFYENKTLKDIFEKHKGQTISFVNADGCPISIKMNSIQDAYTILIYSFKTSDND